MEVNRCGSIGVEQTAALSRRNHKAMIISTIFLNIYHHRYNQLSYPIFSMPNHGKYHHIEIIKIYSKFYDFSK
jgi:hypothetical protein